VSHFCVTVFDWSNFGGKQSKANFRRKKIKIYFQNWRQVSVQHKKVFVNMPAMKKRSYKKKPRASTGWLVKYKPTSSAIVPRAPGLGRSLKTRLETTFFYNATAAASGVFTGSLNVGSCFDPTGSLAAIQPVGFDQLKALYARYLVTGGYVVIEAAGVYSDGLNTVHYPWVMSVSPSTLATAYATYQGAASQPFSKDVLIAKDESKQLYLPFNTQKIIGSRLPPVAEDAGALISADPATGQNVIMNIFAQYGLAAVATITLSIKIVQDVIFDQRIQVVDA